MADVVFHEHGGVGGNAAERFGELAGKVVGGLSGGLIAFDDEEVKDVESDGDVSTEDFGDLAVIFRKGIFAMTFDVKGADDFVVQLQGHGHAAQRAVEAGQIVRVIRGIIANITSAGGGHESGDAVSLTVGKQFQRFALGHTDAEEHFEFVGFGIEDADHKVVEFEQIFGVADDFILHEANPLLDGLSDEGVGFQSGEFASGLVDGVEALLETSAGGGIPNHGSDVGQFGLRIQHGSSDHFEIPVRVGIDDGVSSRAQEVIEVRQLGGTPAESFLEVKAGILTVSGYVLLNQGAEVFDLSIGPEDSAVGRDDADAFADRVENGAGLLIDGGSFEGQKIGGFREDGAKIVLFELLKSFIDVIDGHDLGELSEVLEQIMGPGVLSVEDQDFALANLLCRFLGLYAHACPNPGCRR